MSQLSQSGRCRRNLPGGLLAADRKLSHNGRMKVTFLGTGTSCGVPLLGCNCNVCTSPDPRNHRLRPSLLCYAPDGMLLIDSSPDLRTQLLRERIARIDAVLYTHYHADHIYGLDDLRVFPMYTGRPVPAYAELEVQQVLRQSFSYAFDPATRHLPGGALPKIELHTIEPGQPFDLLGLTCLPLRLLHGPFRVLGFRFGDLAYCTDVNFIPDDTLARLRNLEILILDCLRVRPHPTHFSLEECLGVIEVLRPGRTYFTHISHDLDHARTCQELPSGVELAYDGLTIDG